MSVVTNAIYANGERLEPDSLDKTFELIRERRGLGWIGLYRPDTEELMRVANEFGLHKLAVEDAVHAHQRPKLERYGDTLFVVLRPARYLDASEMVEVGEIHVFLGTDFVVTIRHSESPGLGPVRERLESSPALLALGPEAVLYAILDQVVDGYFPVVEGLRTDLDEIEAQVFGGEPGAPKRIYALSREVIEFSRACQPLSDILEALTAGFDKYGVDIELQRLLRDVKDHAMRVADQVAGFRELIANVLNVNAALVSQRQNEEITQLTVATYKQTEATYAQSEEVKKISAWAAILFAPTLIGTIYGMNFRYMPELEWVVGYPMAIILMVLVGVILHRVFKRQKWI